MWSRCDRDSRENGFAVVFDILIRQVSEAEFLIVSRVHNRPKSQNLTYNLYTLLWKDRLCTPFCRFVTTALTRYTQTSDWIHAMYSAEIISKSINPNKAENRMELLATEFSEENPFDESRETSLAPSEGKLVQENPLESLTNQDGCEHVLKCDHVILKALSKRESRSKVIEIENIVRAFVTTSQTDELILSADLTKTTYDRLLAHRISQHYGLSTRVNKPDCAIVVTRLEGEQRTPLVLKDIEVELEQVEEKEGWHHGRKHRQPGRILKIKENQRQRSIHEGGDFRGKAKHSSRHNHGGYENSNAKIFNNNGPRGQQQMMMPHHEFSGYQAAYVSQEHVKAIMRNPRRDVFDPDFLRHNAHMQHAIVSNGAGMYQQVPIDLVQPIHPQMAQYGHMTPVIMHPCPIPVSQLTPYGGYVSMVPPDAVLYGQPHPYGTQPAQYNNGMALYTGQQEPKAMDPERPPPRSPGQ